MHNKHPTLLVSLHSIVITFTLPTLIRTKHTLTLGSVVMKGKENGKEKKRDEKGMES